MAIQIGRRDFILLLGGAALLVPARLVAQAPKAGYPTKSVRIIVLFGGPTILSRAFSPKSFQPYGANRYSSSISQAPATTSEMNTSQDPILTDIPSCSTPAPLQRTRASIAS